MKKNVSKVEWGELQHRLRTKYPHLTDTDLNIQEGKEHKMLRMVEYKLGKTKHEMRKIIESLYPAINMI